AARGGRRQDKETEGANQAGPAGAPPRDPHETSHAGLRDCALQIASQRPVADQDEPDLPPCLVVASPQGDHRAHERHLVLDRLHPADRAHHESPRSPRRGGRIASLRWRMKDTRIHAVVYLGNPFRGYTDTLAQVILQIPRDGGVVADHRAMQTAQQAIARVRPVDIENVPSVLAVYLHPDTS